MAQFDAFLKIDGIKGESKDSKHPDEIQLESFSWGAMNAGSHSAGGGGGAGKVAFQDFHFTMSQNKASPNLLQHCATGKHIPSAILTLRKAGGTQLEFVKIKLGELLVSSYQSGGSNASTIPTDQIALNFTKIEFDYFEQKADGSASAPVHAGYDLKVQKPV
jgi:type VI secretion system secreted protein Hcp